mgnify:CR=1 FL=1
MKRKPELSFWQIWNLSFGFLGVQIGYSLQNSNTSSIFESLGADVSHLSYFWLAAPVAGMLIQPIIGMFSDAWKMLVVHNFGEKAFILTLTDDLSRPVGLLGSAETKTADGVTRLMLGPLSSAVFEL